MLSASSSFAAPASTALFWLGAGCRRWLSTASDETRMERARKSLSGRGKKNELASTITEILDEVSALGSDAGTLEDGRGRVAAVQHGVVHALGLSNVHVGSVVRFTETGARGLVMALGASVVDVAMLDPHDGVHPHSLIEDTGEPLRTPCGPDTIGRVLTPLGEPLDGGAPLPASRSEWRSCLLERAPSMLARAQVQSASQRMIATGYKVVDMFNPVARGLRTALVGPRQVGKTSMALDIIANQRGARDPLHCVYVAMGHSHRDLHRTLDRLHALGAMDYTTVIAASDQDPFALRYVAPYAGASAANHWRDIGEHALVVYDDLAAHGNAYVHLTRAMNMPSHSLGHVHARLVESAALLDDQHRGGSTTAIALVDVTPKDNPASTQVAEHVVSFVDEVVSLDGELEVWPPIKWSWALGRSKTIYQPKCVRTLTRRLKQGMLRSQLIPAQSAAALARTLGIKLEDELDDTWRHVDTGKRFQALLSQSMPLPLHAQLLSVYGWLLGAMDDVYEHDVPRFENSLVLFAMREHADAMDALKRHCEETPDEPLTEAVLDGLRRAIEAHAARGGEVKQ